LDSDLLFKELFTGEDNTVASFKDKLCNIFAQ